MKDTILVPVKASEVITNPYIFKVTVLEIDKPIPNSQIEDFKEWLDRLPLDHETGMVYDHYCYSKDFNKDIGVKALIKAIPTSHSELVREELEKRMPTSKKCIDLVKEIHLMDAELRPDSYIAEYIHTWIKSTLTQPDKE